jgi:hypothetical protein
VRHFLVLTGADLFFTAVVRLASHQQFDHVFPSGHELLVYLLGGGAAYGPHEVEERY